jgi:hypothetical protein
MACAGKINGRGKYQCHKKKHCQKIFPVMRYFFLQLNAGNAAGHFSKHGLARIHCLV